MIYLTLCVSCHDVLTYVSPESVITHYVTLSQGYVKLTKLTRALFMTGDT